MKFKEVNRESESYKEAEREFTISMLIPSSDWFSAQLIRLILKADINNKARLSKGFPEMVDVVFRYQTEMDYWEKLQKEYNNEI